MKGKPFPTPLRLRQLGREYHGLTPEQKAKLIDEGKDATLAHRHGCPKHRNERVFQSAEEGSLRQRAEALRRCLIKGRAATVERQKIRDEAVRQWTVDRRNIYEPILSKHLPLGYFVCIIFGVRATEPKNSSKPGRVQS